MKFQQKYSIEQVRDIFHANNCKLLTETYQGVTQQLSYLCSCGELSVVSLCRFLKGNRCKKCGIEKSRQSRKIKQESIFALFSKEGYKVINKEYLGNYHPLECQCPKGHSIQMAYGNFKRGRRCKQCYVDSISGSGNVNYDPDREAVMERLKIRRLCKDMVRRTLKSIGTKKIKRCEELLGYTHLELKQHLISINEENASVDHIFPIKAFLDYGIEDVSVINALSNLRVISLKDNLSKNDTYDKKAFEQYLRTQYVFTE